MRQARIMRHSIRNKKEVMTYDETANFSNKHK